MRNLFPAAHAGEPREIHVAEQAVQYRPLRLKVETFHVDQAAIAGGHQHRNPAGPRAFPHD